jgi:hypothetical protein
MIARNVRAGLALAWGRAAAHHGVMDGSVPSPPVTPAAISPALEPPAAVAGPARVGVTLPRGPRGVALSFTVCPGCGLRPGHPGDPLVLVRHPGWVRWLRRLLSAPPVLLAGLGLWALGGTFKVQLAGALLFMFGPAFTLGLSGVVGLLLRQRVALRVPVCPTCAGRVRQAQSRFARARRVTALAASSAVLVAPLGLTTAVWDERWLLYVAAAVGVLAAVSVGAALEWQGSRVLDALVPRVDRVGGQSATLSLPPAWAAVVDRDGLATGTRPPGH